MKTTEGLTLVAEPDFGPPRRRRRWGALAAVLLVVAAMLVAFVLVIDQRDDDEGAGGPAPTVTTSPPEVVDRSTAIWPVAGSTERFTDAVDAAREFASSFLGFTAPIVRAFQPGDRRSGEVEVRPVANGPVTTIMLRQLSGEASWSVLGAATATIEVATPAAGDEISSPVRVTGRAVAFEGTVNAEVRHDSGLGAIGEGIVTGGGDVMRAFAADVSFETPGAPYGALVLFAESGDNGQVWAAAALRVAFTSTDVDAAACGTYRSPRRDPAAGQMEVEVYFNCDAKDGVALQPAYRLVPKSQDALRASLEALLAGPNAEERNAQIGSWFSDDTAGLLRSVTLTAGHAVVDFDDLRSVIPNASSSAGSERLLSQLDATVFQFREVDSVEYRLGGSCADFNEWLQYGGCEPRTRPASTD